jgi:DNA polymerase III subunit epsilon
MAWWRWRSSPADPPGRQRWIVVDVETTGLDTQRCGLLSIAALALEPAGARAELRLRDSFEVVLRHEAPSADVDRANILLHGIGVGAQRGGVDPASALARFADWVGGAPLLGFHVAFDRAVIERHAGLHRVPPPTRHWLDIEPLAAVLKPQVRAKTLDEWMAALGVVCALRHQAAADVLATAELLLKLWPRLAHESPAAARGEIVAAQRLAASARWLGS